MHFDPIGDGRTRRNDPALVEIPASSPLLSDQQTLESQPEHFGSQRSSALNMVSTLLKSDQIGCGSTLLKNICTIHSKMEPITT